MKQILSTILIISMLFSCREKTTDKGIEEDQHVHAEKEFSKEALNNMGVKIIDVKYEDYIIHSKIYAKVKNRPQNTSGVYAPWSGIITEIDVELGEYIVKDKVVAYLMRDPLPRVSLNKTAGVLKVATEEYHKTIAEIKKVQANLNNLKVELERLQNINKNSKLTIIPKKDIIDLEYKIKTSLNDIKVLKTKLIRHGFNDTEIKDLQSGKTLKLSKNFWLNNLKANGLWDKMNEKLYSILPKKSRDLYWTLACISELVSTDFINDKIINEIKSNKILQENFQDVAAMLQIGYSIEKIKNLADLKIFEPKIPIHAPIGVDIALINTSIGQHIEKGDKILTVINKAQMILEASARGTEKLELKKAVINNLKIKAKPVTQGASAIYENLSIAALQEDNKSHSLNAIIPIKNNIISRNSQNLINYRSWDLQEGDRYFALIPFKTFKKVIVVPSSAVVDSGSDKIVLVKVGKTFIPKKVILKYIDDEVAVLDASSEVIAMESVVIKGAFELHQAINSDDNAVVPHQCGGH